MKKNELIVLNSRVVFKQTTITRYFILIWAARKYGNIRALILFKSSLLHGPGQPQLLFFRKKMYVSA